MENFFNQLKNIVSASETFDKIIVVGKGNSIKQIDPACFTNAFIIHLNDSERIIPGSICIFHSKWVIDSLLENGLRSAHYFTTEAAIEGKQVDRSKFTFVPHQTTSFESFENLVGDLTSRDLVLSDFLILSALKIAYLISQVKNKQLSTYLVGFDFQVQSDTPINDYSGHELAFKNIFLATQKAYVSFLKNYMNDSGNVSVVHVGNSDISDCEIREFNHQFSSKSATGKAPFNNRSAYMELLERVQKENHVLTVAEFTNNHLGSEERLRKMVALAKEAGADMIKVQKRDVASFYKPEELASPYQSPFGTTLRDYREGVELNDHLFEVLIEECTAHEIVWFASVLDYPSLEYLMKFDPVLVKLPSTISNHRDYLQQVARDFNGDVVISTGFTDRSYEDFVLNTFLTGRNLFLLQCTSSYPAPPESCQIGVVRHYEELSVVLNKPTIIPGYSSHDIGNIGSMLAVAAGAKMIEKHVKLGNAEWVHFDGVALDLLDNTFHQFVQDVRKAQLMTGSKVKQIHHQEHHKYSVNKSN
jgi:sialic acid synthase SpsE